jgi:transposase
MKTKTTNVEIKKINKYAAGADIGSRSHFIAISPELTKDNVREFSTFTEGLIGAIKWLKEHNITSVAMESTGIYWINFYDMLQQNGIEAVLVNARHVKNVPGRKSDVLDAQWLQELHSYGLLRGSFRPKDEICTLRGYMRHRENLVNHMVTQVLLMQKSLGQMNIQLHHVVGDITGVTGLKIIRAIIDGQRDTKILASYRDRNCKNNEATIEKSLQGNYRQEHLFSLKQSLEIYDFYNNKLQECDKEIKALSAKLYDYDLVLPEAQKRIRKSRKNDMQFNTREELFKITGVDLTMIDGISGHTAFKIISEIGVDVSKWPSAKHFASWLGLAPGTKISGGKILNSATKTCVNRVANALRKAAQTLYKSKSALGGFLQRKKAQLGSPKAITATAHKLAKIIYHMLKNKTEYKNLGADYYEKQYQEKAKKSIIKKAAKLGLKVIEDIKPAVI